MRLGLRLLAATLLLAGMAPATVLLVVESRRNLAHVRAVARSEVIAMAKVVAEQIGFGYQLEALPLPSRASLEVIDAEGTVVSARGEASGTATTPFGPEIRKLALGGAQLHEGPGGDAVRRVFAFSRVGSGQGTALWVIAAVPTDVVEEPVRAAAVHTMAAWGIAMLAVIVGTGFVAEYLILRRLRAVAHAAALISGGDYGARTGLRPASDELGQLVGAFDQMAESLDRLQRQNRLLLDSIGDGIIGLDREALVVFANPAAARLLGIPIGELKGQPFAALIRHGGPRGDPCLVQQSLADGQVHLTADDTFTTRDGRSFPVESVTTPVVDAGRIVGAVVALRDATARRRLEEELRHAQKMEAVGQLAGGVAHDFNNLLTAIITCARMVEESLPSSHPAQSDVAEILSSGDRAAQLTRQLLAFGRRQRLAPRAIDLREAVTGMERMLRRILGETIELSVTTCPDPVVVYADPSQIEMVVLNLAVNARDAMPSGGPLSISVNKAEAADPARSGGEELPPGELGQIVVRDAGGGMDEETQERIFEPFFTTKPSGKGTGLGLATVYGIVKQSGGAIHVRSTPGQGAEFRVLLPLSEADVQPQARPAAPVVGGTERVLVLEDDDVLRVLVCRALRGAGYVVTEASRPSAAVARTEEEDFDLVVADSHPPRGERLAVLPAHLRGEARATCAPDVRLHCGAGCGFDGASGRRPLPAEALRAARPARQGEAGAGRTRAAAASCRRRSPLPGSGRGEGRVRGAHLTAVTVTVQLAALRPTGRDPPARPVSADSMHRFEASSGDASTSTRATFPSASMVSRTR